MRKTLSLFIFAVAFLPSLGRGQEINVNQAIDAAISNQTARNYIRQVEACNQGIIADFNQLADGANATDGIKESMRCYSRIAYEIIEKYFPTEANDRKTDFDNLGTIGDDAKSLAIARLNSENAVRNYISQISQ